MKLGNIAKLFTSGGGTPICQPIRYGRYHLPVLWPPFFANLTPNDPIFNYSPHSMTFFLQNFNVKVFRRILKILSIFSRKGEFLLKFDKLYTEWPPVLRSLHQKRPNFLNLTPNDPLFLRNPTPNAPLFSFSGRYIPVTFIFECPSPRTFFLSFFLLFVALCNSFHMRNQILTKLGISELAFFFFLNWDDICFALSRIQFLDGPPLQDHTRIN